MKRLPLAALLGAISLSACGQPPAHGAAVKADKPAYAEPVMAAGTPEARAREAIRRINPKLKMDAIGAAPIPGFREVIVGGQILYVSDDGRYLFQGTLFDVNARKDLSEASFAKVRRELLKTIPLADRIVFAPPAPKHTVTVFTDVECAYCRKLHSEIADYNKQGIAVQYVAFPRAGLGSADYKKMVAVWCAADPRQALTDAKLDKPVPMKTCANPVTMQYNLGQRMGLNGTPMILTADGTQFGGYVPPTQLRAMLDKHASGG